MDLTTVLNFLQDNQTLALFGVAISAAGLQHKAVKWLALSKGWVKQLITVTVALGLAIVPAAMGVVSANTALPHFAEILSIMMVFYNLVLKPASSTLEKAKAYEANTTTVKAELTATTANEKPVVATTTATETVERPVYEG